MFDFALHTAKRLDQYYAKNGIVKGPLHGLPISLKDQFHVKGYDTTMGYVGWIGTYEGSRDPTKVHRMNSQIVEELLSLGAVLFCKVPRSRHELFWRRTDHARNCHRRAFLRRCWYAREAALRATASAKIVTQLGETVNNIIGTTLNPMNQLLSCGGSSGGLCRPRRCYTSPPSVTDPVRR